MTMKSNTFSLSTNNGIQTGAFNIYQGKNGGIYLFIDHCHTLLSQSQILDLQLPVDQLRDFDQRIYRAFYSKAHSIQTDIPCEIKQDLQTGLTHLPSAGSAIDSNLFIYPVLPSGLADLNAGVPPSEWSRGWWTKLDSNDLTKIELVMRQYPVRN